MEQQPSEDGELPEGQAGEAAEGVPSGATDGGRAPSDPVAEALALEAEEIRRLVEAGAGTPDAIRELAARLREHREREEALWRTEVRPKLVREGRGRLRGPASSSRPARSARDDAPANAAILGLVILGLVAVLVVAANTSGWVLVLPVVALLAWAWQQGRDSGG
ncbi:MAG: hypothetical protein ACRDYW_07925 [Acidimicrobiales bacterium]